MFRLPLPITTAGERQILNELAAIRQQLAAVAAQLNQLRKETAALPQRSDFDTLVRTIDEETTTIAARIDGLTQQLATAQKAGDGSISAEDATAIMTALQTESARLRTLGANPADPVPGGPGATPPAPDAGAIQPTA